MVKIDHCKQTAPAAALWPPYFGNPQLGGKPHWAVAQIVSGDQLSSCRGPCRHHGRDLS
jgi:hypothetical protein